MLAGFGVYPVFGHIELPERDGGSRGTGSTSLGSRAPTWPSEK
jgi:hypothetical protein